MINQYKNNVSLLNSLCLYNYNLYKLAFGAGILLSAMQPSSSNWLAFGFHHHASSRVNEKVTLYFIVQSRAKLSQSVLTLHLTCHCHSVRLVN